MSEPAPFRLGVFKFASCDGCQVQILNLEAELLALAERLEIAYFLEASSDPKEGPYDLALVEGSVTTARDVERIRGIREESRMLVTIGACATAGGIQWLRNRADAEAWKGEVYPEPEWLDCLPTSTPIGDHVRVDDEIHGCPVDSGQVRRVLTRAIRGATPDLPGHSVCIECKRRGNVCVLVAKALPCMGPVTRTGCGALCPGLARDCYACFGPMEGAQPATLARRLRELGLSEEEVRRRFSGITGNQPAFRDFTARHAGGEEAG